MHGPGLHSVTLSDIRALLLDIEGTTTPIAFVHDVLFPYARARTHAYLRAHAEEIAPLQAEHAADPSAPPWESAEAYVYWLMDRDRKSTALKSLQGKIWEAGYRGGALQGRGEVYPDVRPALARWRKQGKDIAIFSSGSVQAQRNLFANTTDGDLTSYLRGYFDTTTGSKREPRSYGRIAAILGHASAEVMFISDMRAELDAAHGAGMQTVLCVRPPALAPDPDASTHAVIRTFDDILPMDVQRG